MKKKLIRGLIALTLMIGGTATIITITAPDAEACKSCNFSNVNRKCGNCNSPKLYSVHYYYGNNGRLHSVWECEDCKHRCVTESKNGKEVLLTSTELKNKGHQEKKND